MMSFPSHVVCRRCEASNPEARVSPFAHERAPGRPRVGCSQPSLPPLEALQVLETLALVAGAAEVELLHILIVAQLIGRAVKHDLALFHDVAVACDRKRGARILL